jgi:hypothetical protein
MSILDDLLAAIDNSKRVAKRNISDLLSDIEGFVEKANDTIDLQNKQKKAVIRDGVLGYENKTGDEITDDMISQINISGLGIIRSSGLFKNINMYHGMGNKASQIDKALNRKSLTNPSIAIAKNNAFPFSKTPTLVFNPNSPLLDPATNKANQLLNRDFYTTRTKEPLNRGYRLDSKDLRYTEGDSPGGMFEAAINASPRFESFVKYETSSFGAKKLTESPLSKSKFNELQEGLKEDYIDWLQRDPKAGEIVYSYYSKESYERLKKAALDGDLEALNIMLGLKSAPSNYAELKVVGEVPLQQRDISALLIPEDYSHLVIPQVIEDNLGILTGTPKELMNRLSPETGDLYKSMAESIYSVVKERRKTPWTPINVDEILRKNTIDYIDDTGINTIVRDIDDRETSTYIVNKILNSIYSSNKFASDIASMITSADADIVTEVYKGIK